MTSYPAIISRSARARRPTLPNLLHTLLGLCFSLLIFFSMLANSAPVPPHIPPFQVQASVTNAEYSLNAPGEPDAVGVHISFTYSNGVWEIEETASSYPKSLLKHHKPVSASRLLNCKKVADGVRYYSRFFMKDGTPTTQGLPLATVTSNAFPPVAFKELLLPWLAFCPEPELPIASPHRMKEFTSDEMLSHPENVGDYSAKYLESNAVVLSELNIADNADADPMTGNIRHRGPPFRFQDFHFAVLATTNLDGLTFPSKAIIRLMSPLPNAKAEQEQWTTFVCTLTVDSIRIGAVSNSPPISMIAQDLRISTPDGRSPLQYRVTNDNYAAKTNKRLVKLASITPQRVPPPRTAVRIWFAAILALITIFPAGFFYRHYKRTKNKGQT